MEPIARMLWAPKKVQNEESTRAISIATKPKSFWLPPLQPYP
jgi:hypothetical protein